MRATHQISRRTALGWLGVIGAAGLAGGCNGGSDTNESSESSLGTTPTTPTTPSTPVVGQCTLIPQETAGPYPLSAVLTNAAMLRQDIRDGKTGIPLTLTFLVQNLNQSCGPVADAYVYVWHCDKDGLYSGYNQPGGNTLGQTFLRGIAKTDADGNVQFQTIYPGWYQGRITHVHFQVFLISPTETATATSQLAFPETLTQQVYQSSLYASRGQNTSVPSFAADNVFADGVDYQMAEVTGDLESGLVASLAISVAL